jgi:hypothetical protein
MAACVRAPSQRVPRAWPVGSADCYSLRVRQASAFRFDCLLLEFASHVFTAAHIERQSGYGKHESSVRKLAAPPLFVPKPETATLGRVRHGRFDSDRGSERRLCGGSEIGQISLTAGVKLRGRGLRAEADAARRLRAGACPATARVAKATHNQNCGRRAVLQPCELTRRFSAGPKPGRVSFYAELGCARRQLA